MCYIGLLTDSRYEFNGQSHFIVCTLDQKWPAGNNVLMYTKEEASYVLVDAIYTGAFRRFHNRQGDSQTMWLFNAYKCSLI